MLSFVNKFTFKLKRMFAFKKKIQKQVFFTLNFPVKLEKNVRKGEKMNKNLHEGTLF